MKKSLLFGLLAMTMVTFAQEVKRVAILEPVDRENKISYANKLILRSNLAKAVTETPGYEAYDRTDMDAILGEQNFQRTGMVSSDQIKKLGEMTGAKYVLVAEAVVVDANNMYITAKLLDVETARTEMTNNQMMGVSAKEIQRGCQLLAAKLIKPVYATTPKKKSIEETKEIALEPIEKISNNEYRYGETILDRKAYQNFIYQNCPAAWKKHRQATALIATGWTLLAIGLPMNVAWGYDVYWRANIPNADVDYLDYERDCIIIGAVGAALSVISIPLLTCGYNFRNNTYKTFNNKCTNKRVQQYSFNLTAGQNGLGLALQF